MCIATCVASAWGDCPPAGTRSCTELSGMLDSAAVVTFAANIDRPRTLAVDSVRGDRLSGGRGTIGGVASQVMSATGAFLSASSASHAPRLSAACGTGALCDGLLRA